MTALDLSPDELLIWAGDGGEVPISRRIELVLLHVDAGVREPVRGRPEPVYEKRSLCPVHIRNQSKPKYFRIKLPLRTRRTNRADGRKVAA